MLGSYSLGPYNLVSKKLPPKMSLSILMCVYCKSCKYMYVYKLCEKYVTVSIPIKMRMVFIEEKKKQIAFYGL